MQARLAQTEQRAKTIRDQAKKEEELLISRQDEAKKRLEQVNKAVRLSEEKAREDRDHIIKQAEDKASSIVQEAKKEGKKLEEDTKEKCTKMLSETKDEITEKLEKERSRAMFQ